MICELNVKNLLLNIFSVTLKGFYRLFSISKNESLITIKKSFIMKKTIIISAMALCFTVGTINAKTLSYNIENYNVETVFKVNSFCVSIAKGDLETVKKLLARGEDVNQKSDGMTPVMYAAKYNRTEILELLIAKGADLKAKSNKGYTAIKYAEMHGATDAQEILESTLSKK
jgi:uncharacterized protein